MSASTRAREHSSDRAGAHAGRSAVHDGAGRTGGAAAILSLQRRAGNAAVQRWIGARAVQRACACDAAPPEFLLRKSSGSPLPPQVQQFMEDRLAHDFSGVRVHDDAHAAQSADAISAHAYTAGRDIFFAAGQYRPDTHDGRRLLAHELTHVVQQGGQPVSAQADLRISAPGDRWEQEADRVAAAVMDERDTPRSIGITAVAPPMLQAKQCVDGWFTSLQNRPIAPGVNDLQPHWYPSGKFGTNIELAARFEPLGDEANCHKGEYRQFVRSNRKVNDKELKAPGNIDGKTFHEDKVPTKLPTGKGKATHTYRPGHRKDQLSKYDDKATVYSPNVLGCHYHMSDFAHVGDIKKEDKVEVRDEFIGQLIDLCTDGLNPDQDTPYDAKQTLDQVSWKIEGTLTIGPDGFAVITKPDAKD